MRYRPGAGMVMVTLLSSFAVFCQEKPPASEKPVKPVPRSVVIGVPLSPKCKESLRVGSGPGANTADGVQERAGETWDRGVSASGVARQMSAILSQPDRTHSLRELDVPALVIHGMSDKMVHVSGGRATSHALRGSELLLVPGMGHDVPPELHDTFVDAITRTARRAR